LKSFIDAYGAYRTAFDLARHYRDEIVPLGKKISEQGYKLPDLWHNFIQRYEETKEMPCENVDMIVPSFGDYKDLYILKGGRGSRSIEMAK